jgi:exodeoxyribonuclease I
MSSIFWHDYETFGADPRRDRPCQFAGIRTDFDLNPIGLPVELFCRPAPDFLPDPGAVAITGITPGEALRKGVPEAEFCARIAAEFLEPATCVAGYNSLRFDDEVTRHLLYRCLRDPYEREWKHGNSRWDLIDLLRMTQALRPQGIVWPEREPGVPSFRLEELTRANGIDHVGAHDALADVRATIAMAKLVKQQQPKLYEWYFALRSKQRVLPLLDLQKQEPLVHVSRRYPATRGCMAIVLPLCRHPQNSNGIVVADLLADPESWLQLDVETLQQRLYTPTAELPEGTARIPLKTVHINRCPALAPLNVLTAEVQQRYALDLTLVQRHREAVLANRGLAQRLQQVFADKEWPASSDPDLQLYGGAFFDEHDKRQMEGLHRLPPARLAALHCDFHDPRLPELLFRFRARNYPETLNAQEQARWLQFCRQRLLGELPGAGLSLADYETVLREAEAGGLAVSLAAELRAYARTLAAQCQLEPL